MATPLPRAARKTIGGDNGVVGTPQSEILPKEEHGAMQAGRRASGHSEVSVSSLASVRSSAASVSDGDSAGASRHGNEGATHRRRKRTVARAKGSSRAGHRTPGRDFGEPSAESSELDDPLAEAPRARGDTPSASRPKQRARQRSASRHGDRSRQSGTRSTGSATAGVTQGHRKSRRTTPRRSADDGSADDGEPENDAGAAARSGLHDDVPAGTAASFGSGSGAFHEHGEVRSTEKPPRSTEPIHAVATRAGSASRSGHSKGVGRARDPATPSSEAGFAMDAGLDLDSRSVRLKCYHNTEIRAVAVSEGDNFSLLASRLANDYGFPVSLKYEDSDGDMVTLSSQNDLNELITNEWGRRYVAVHVSEASSQTVALAPVDVSRVLASPTPSGAAVVLNPLEELPTVREGASCAAGKDAVGDGASAAVVERRGKLNPIGKGDEIALDDGGDDAEGKEESKHAAREVSEGLASPGDDHRNSGNAMGPVAERVTDVVATEPGSAPAVAVDSSPFARAAPLSRGGAGASRSRLPRRVPSAGLRRPHSGLRHPHTPGRRAHIPSTPSTPHGDTTGPGKIRWQRGEVLGQGAFGTVYLGLNLDSGELMAVKQLDTAEVSAKELASLEHEVAMMERFDHENIVRYLGTQHAEETLAIFLEYVPGGSIRSLVNRFGKLDEAVVRVYTRQLLLGLEYLHRHGIAHRDIKGANVLVANDGTIKLADFGASKKLGHKSVTANTGLKGTPLWMAPEVIKEQQSQRGWKKADIWSVACTVIEMATGKPPWSHFSNPVTAMYHIACGEELPDLPAGMSQHGLDFLSQCFKHDPSERPDVTLLLLHPFVSTMSSTHVQHLAEGMFPVRPTTAGDDGGTLRGLASASGRELASRRRESRPLTESHVRQRAAPEASGNTLPSPASPFPMRSAGVVAADPGVAITESSGNPLGLGDAPGIDAPAATPSVRQGSSSRGAAGDAVADPEMEDIVQRWENVDVLETLDIKRRGSIASVLGEARANTASSGPRNPDPGSAPTVRPREIGGDTPSSAPDSRGIPDEPSATVRHSLVLANGGSATPDAELRTGKKPAQLGKRSAASAPATQVRRPRQPIVDTRTRADPGSASNSGVLPARAATSGRAQRHSKSDHAHGVAKVGSAGPQRRQKSSHRQARARTVGAARRQRQAERAPPAPPASSTLQVASASASEALDSPGSGRSGSNSDRRSALVSSPISVPRGPSSDSRDDGAFEFSLPARAVAAVNDTAAKSDCSIPAPDSPATAPPRRRSPRPHRVRSPATARGRREGHDRTDARGGRSARASDPAGPGTSDRIASPRDHGSSGPAMAVSLSVSPLKGGDPSPPTTAVHMSGSAGPGAQNSDSRGGGPTSSRRRPQLRVSASASGLSDPQYAALSSPIASSPNGSARDGSTQSGSMERALQSESGRTRAGIGRGRLRRAKVHGAAARNPRVQRRRVQGGRMRADGARGMNLQLNLSVVGEAEPAASSPTSTTAAAAAAAAAMRVAQQRATTANDSRSVASDSGMGTESTGGSDIEDSVDDGEELGCECGERFGLAVEEVSSAVGDVRKELQGLAEEVDEDVGQGWGALTDHISEVATETERGSALDSTYDIGSVVSTGLGALGMRGARPGARLSLTAMHELHSHRGSIRCSVMAQLGASAPLGLPSYDEVMAGADGVGVGTQVQALVFATGGEDGTVRVCSAMAGASLATLPHHRAQQPTHGGGRQPAGRAADHDSGGGTGSGGPRGRTAVHTPSAADMADLIVSGGGSSAAKLRAMAKHTEHESPEDCSSNPRSPEPPQRRQGGGGSGTSVRREPGTAIVTVVCLLYESNLLVSGTDDGYIWLWDIASGKKLRRLRGHAEAVTCMVTHTANSAGTPASPERRPASSGVAVATLRGSRGGRKSKLTALTGVLVISGSEDKTIRVWSLGERRARIHTLLGHTGGITAIVVIPNSWYVASASSDQTVRIWDLRTGRLKCEMNDHFGSVQCLLPVPVVPGAESGKTIVAASSGLHDADGVPVALLSGARDGSIKLWDSRGDCSRTLRGHRGAVTVLRLAPILTGSARAASLPQGVARSDPVTAMAPSVSRPGSRAVPAGGGAGMGGGVGVVSGSVSVAEDILEDRLGDLHGTVASHSSYSSHELMVAATDTTPIATGASAVGSTTRRSSVGSAQSVRTHMSYRSVTGTSAVGASATHGSGLSNVGGTARAHRGQRSAPSQLNPSSASSSSAHMAPTVTEEQSLPDDDSKSRGRRQARSVTRVMSSGTDGVLRLWDYATGRCLRKLEGHRGAVTSLQWFLPGVCASGGSDGTMRVWNLASGQVVYTVPVGSVVTQLRRHNEWICAGTKEGIVRVWRWGAA